MADGPENKVKGSIDKVKGEAKDQFGKLTDDMKKQASGKKDKVKGEARQKYGEVQRDDSEEQ